MVTGDTWASIEPGWIKLAPNEQVVWSGRPDPRLLPTRPGDILVVPVGLLLAFYGFEMLRAFWSDVIDGGGGAAQIIELLLLTIGYLAFSAFLTVGPFVHRRADLARTEYLLTNRRAVIRNPGHRFEVRQRRLAPDMKLDFRIRRDGRGTIHFADSPKSSTYNSRYERRLDVRDFAFTDIRRADEVVVAMGHLVGARMDDRRNSDIPAWISEARRLEQVDRSD